MALTGMKIDFSLKTVRKAEGVHIDEVIYEQRAPEDIMGVTTISSKEGYKRAWKEGGKKMTAQGTVTIKDVKLGGEKKNILIFTIAVSAPKDPLGSRQNFEETLYFRREANNELICLSNGEAGLPEQQLVKHLNDNPKRLKLK